MDMSLNLHQNNGNGNMPILTNDKQRVLFTHFDLDGVGCEIIMKKAFAFKHRYCMGYPKFRERIKKKDYLGYDSCFITDLSLTQDQYNEIKGVYGDRMVWIDHHQSSLSVEKQIGDTNSIIDISRSGTAICAFSFQKLINFNAISRFIVGVDAYDMWRWRTHPKEFSYGYDLNTLFWYYGYFQFYDAFCDNPSRQFTNTEKAVIKNSMEDKKKMILAATKERFGEKSMVIIGAHDSVVNDFSLTYPNIDLFYIINTDKDYFSVSIRSNKEGTAIGTHMRILKDNYSDMIHTAGGHSMSGGMGFNKNSTMNNVLDIIEELDYYITGKANDSFESPSDDDIPF
jgi:oligoribonuclease NrnB/cAMP/cGMP phosphodiesterase (DHH superfamily)